MFLDKIKDFLIKKSVKKQLQNVKLLTASDYIKSVGIIFDEQYLDKKDSIVAQLENKGIDKNKSRFIVFKNSIKKDDKFDYPTFSFKNISWSSTFDEGEIEAFVKFPFDLLISYYDYEKSPLLLATHNSKALFKVGFSEVDNRLNHFLINTSGENDKVFIDELFKYLKILKKI